jgi:hypothetical protein
MALQSSDATIDTVALPLPREGALTRHLEKKKHTHHGAAAPPLQSVLHRNFPWRTF